MADDSASAFRKIPAVNDLVDTPVLTAWCARTSRALVVAAARAVLDAHRAAIAAGDPGADDVPPADGSMLEHLARRVAARLETAERPRLAPVINATGIVIHTGLGRAPLAPAAVEAMAAVARGYAPVELDLESGGRGRRVDVVRPLLCELTGAESATVVNNTAAAVMLVLAALARGRTVVVSRGELIEIGGSFRLPHVMEAGGALLREVGTTNRTRLADYAEAIDETTAAIMKVHTSNYRIEGFTRAVSLLELVELGRAHDVPVVHDIGSGVLGDLRACGVEDEPDARTSVEAGADLVLFSGDKLLGGPQAGIIVGRRAWVEAVERHPMMRALRVDKLTLSALAATLQLHRDADRAVVEIPVLAMLRTPVEALRSRGAALVEQLRSIEGIERAVAHDAEAFAGGGTLPAHGVPSIAIEVTARGRSEDELARRLRLGTPAVVSRVQDGAVWLDLRTVPASLDAALIAAVRGAVGSPSA